MRKGRGTCTVGIVIDLVTACKLPEAGALHGYQELPLAGPTVVPVEAVIAVAAGDTMLQIDSAAEHLEAVVVVVVRLHIVDCGAAADSIEGDAVDLAPRLDLEAAELDDHILQC